MLETTGRGDYRIENMEVRARAAIEAKKPVIDNWLSLYEEHQIYRENCSLPVVSFLGYSRAGKDTSAEYFCRALNIRYGGSTSQVLLPFVAHMAGVSEETAFAERHDHRDFWLNAGHAVRANDLTLLVRLSLGLGDVSVGVRGRTELHGCVRDKVLDLLVWIDNPRVQKDSTVEFTADDCDLVVSNHGSYLDLCRRLDKLVLLLKSDFDRVTRRLTDG